MKTKQPGTEIDLTKPGSAATGRDAWFYVSREACRYAGPGLTAFGSTSTLAYAGLNESK